jgi:hypothetical protein
VQAAFAPGTSAGCSNSASEAVANSSWSADASTSPASPIVGAASPTFEAITGTPAAINSNSLTDCLLRAISESL